MKKLFHMQEFFRLFFLKLEERNTRDLRNHETHVFATNDWFILLLLLFPITLSIF